MLLANDQDGDTSPRTAIRFALRDLKRHNSLALTASRTHQRSHIPDLSNNATRWSSLLFGHTEAFVRGEAIVILIVSTSTGELRLYCRVASDASYN